MYDRNGNKNEKCFVIKRKETTFKHSVSLTGTILEQNQDTSKCEPLAENLNFVLNEMLFPLSLAPGAVWLG